MKKRQPSYVEGATQLPAELRRKLARQENYGHPLTPDDEFAANFLIAVATGELRVLRTLRQNETGEEIEVEPPTVEM